MRKRLLLGGIIGVSARYFAPRSAPARRHANPRSTARGCPRRRRLVSAAPQRPSLGGHVREPHPTGIFAALGQFDYRFRKVLPVIGLALAVGD